MTKHIKILIHAVGSIVDIYPCTDYRRFVPRQSAEERMSGHWERVGKSMDRAIGRIKHEQKTASR